MWHNKRTAKDVMSGLIAGRTDVCSKIITDNWDGLEMKGWKVLLDLLKFGPSDMKISTSMYEFGKRAAGESHINPMVVVRTWNQCGKFGKFLAKIYRKVKKIPPEMD